MDSEQAIEQAQKAVLILKGRAVGYEWEQYVDPVAINHYTALIRADERVKAKERLAETIENLDHFYMTMDNTEDNCLVLILAQVEDMHQTEIQKAESALQALIEKGAK